jgi:hypothetical protein
MVDYASGQSTELIKSTTYNHRGKQFNQIDL